MLNNFILLWNVLAPNQRSTTFFRQPQIHDHPLGLAHASPVIYEKFVHTNSPRARFELRSLNPPAMVLPTEPTFLDPLKEIF